MEYPQPPAAPLAIQVIRELTSSQTLRFFVVVVLLALVAFLVVATQKFDALRDPFMLIVGTMFEPVITAVRSSNNGK